MPGIVIIGAGECGARAAFALRERGFAGPVTLVGDEAEAPYERPPLSKSGAQPKRIATPEACRAAGIDLMTGLAATAIDRQAKAVTLSSGARLPYGHLILATGAKARVNPAWPGVLSLRTAADAAAIHARIAPGARVVLIGGGFIGLELAALAQAMGAHVTLLESAPRLMGRAVPAGIAAFAEAHHRAAGIDIRLDARIESAASDQVALADGGRLDADLVVAGIGSVPETSLAEAAGLAVDNGIIVDDRLRTTDPAIFAAGDCCAFPHQGRRIRLESWRAARDHAEHMAAVITGDDRPLAKVPWFWSDQGGLSLQMAGLPAAGAAQVRRPVADGFILFEIGADGSLAAASGIASGNAVAKEIRLAEMLIERGARPDPDALADPAFNLKSLLKAP